MGVTPSGLRDRPELTQDDRPYLDGYRALAGGRTSSGFGPNPISVADVYAYLMLVSEDRVEDRLCFLRVIQAMDTTLLEHAAKQAKASGGSETKQADPCK